MRKVSYLVGFIEASALASYAISLLIAAKNANSTVGAPVIETVIYLIFAALILLTALGIKNGQSVARTPYFLIQIFVGILAYTLFAGTDVAYKAAGVIVGLIAVTGFVALLKSPTSES